MFNFGIRHINRFGLGWCVVYRGMGWILALRQDFTPYFDYWRAGPAEVLEYDE
jgi:hypothetical protein